MIFNRPQNREINHHLVYGIIDVIMTASEVVPTLVDLTCRDSLKCRCHLPGAIRFATRTPGFPQVPAAFRPGDRAMSAARLGVVLSSKDLPPRVPASDPTFVRADS